VRHPGLLFFSTPYLPYTKVTPPHIPLLFGAMLISFWVPSSTEIMHPLVHLSDLQPHFPSICALWCPQVTCTYLNLK
jgi:hypothetical protein